jgi:hypothetical protein
MGPGCKWQKSLLPCWSYGDQYRHLMGPAGVGPARITAFLLWVLLRRLHCVMPRFSFDLLFKVTEVKLLVPCTAPRGPFVMAHAITSLTPTWHLAHSHMMTLPGGHGNKARVAAAQVSSVETPFSLSRSKTDPLRKAWFCEWRHQFRRIFNDRVLVTRESSAGSRLMNRDSSWNHHVKFRGPVTCQVIYNLPAMGFEPRMCNWNLQCSMDKMVFSHCYAFPITVWTGRWTPGTKMSSVQFPCNIDMVRVVSHVYISVRGWWRNMDGTPLWYNLIDGMFENENRISTLADNN